VSLVIRAVRPEQDVEAIAAIYRPYVTDSVITFELDPPDADEFRRRIASVVPTYPWLVAERDGVLLGYAYGSSYRTRAAYRWVVETGIYCAQAARGQRIGGPLYQALLDELARRGFVAAMGVLTAGNPASTALHEKLGFREVGTQPGIGYKHGAWHDVVFWQKDLAPRTSGPAETVRG
jgi:L-amino acid N-acyltransferase YncA